ncbi:uncharacterized protein [Macrobrachium rosenbergii]|uniref:uncharacterized protein isoform X2 n=1 Tax=Macrobrachium rosenbergii TaxID=79674 RepID=UPI0034D50910
MMRRSSLSLAETPSEQRMIATSEKKHRRERHQSITDHRTVLEDGHNSRKDENVRCCQRIASRLMAFDDVVHEVVDYLSPLVIMILLSCTLNATTMLYLISQNLIAIYYYLTYSFLKTMSVVSIARLTEPLRWKRENCLREIRKILVTCAMEEEEEAVLRNVEKLLQASPQFHVYQLFTLDCRILLPVAHGVVTYLVICFQFNYSEDPRLVGNSTADTE